MVLQFSALILRASNSNKHTTRESSRVFKGSLGSEGPKALCSDEGAHLLSNLVQQVLFPTHIIFIFKWDSKEDSMKIPLILSGLLQAIW
mmetsp:Transcript_29431/g.71730  ORF Transcript_29431/g.71730 Transcript_29431/m.71730 type:complete len:89 (+) Transcript_29431:818-1084(+)